MRTVNKIIHKMREISTDAILTRLVKVLGAKNDSELARMLSTNSSTISTWKKRDSVPLAICEIIAREHGVSMDWLLYGEGLMRRDEAGATALQQAPGGHAVDPREQAMLALWRELDEGAQREIQHVAQEKKRLSAIETQLQELTAAVAALNRSA